MKRRVGQATAYSNGFEAGYFLSFQDPLGAVQIAPTFFKTLNRIDRYAYRVFHSWITIFNTRRMDECYHYTALSGVKEYE